MESSRRSRSRPRHVGGAASIRTLSPDLLRLILAPLDHWDLVRCSAVCKPWKTLIHTSSLLRDLYHRRNPRAAAAAPVAGTEVRAFFEELAMDEHRLAVAGGAAEVHQWTAHSARVNLCRMKRGLILTGGEDKVLRLWSAESYSCLDGFSWSYKNDLVDCDFDENKIVGLSDSDICIWSHKRQKSVFHSRGGIFTRGLCMRYIDPEAAIGCEDGGACIFDLYSGCCSRTIRMHDGPVTSLALTEDNLIYGGSTSGTIAVADFSTGEQLAVLKSAISRTGIKSLCVNLNSSLLFAGSTSGHAHCWDLRTFRPLWETRVSPNVIYATHLQSTDLSTLAVGGLDGVLRILNQNTGELLSSLIMGRDNAVPVSKMSIQKQKAIPLAEDACIHQIDRWNRPPITSLAVGMKKIVTTHNEKYVRMWKFHE